MFAMGMICEAKRRFIWVLFVARKIFAMGTICKPSCSLMWVLFAVRNGACYGHNLRGRAVYAIRIAF